METGHKDNVKEEAGSSESIDTKSISLNIDDISEDITVERESGVKTNDKITNIATGKWKRKRHDRKKDQSQRKRQKKEKVIKRKPRTRVRMRSSALTVYTRVSSSDSRAPCDYCGHHCCQRRYNRCCRSHYTKTNRDRKRSRLNKKKLLTVSLQVGSRSNMLSPLCITTNAVPLEKQESPNLHHEITPEMIYQSLRRLTMWRQNITSISLMEYLMRNYPVNGNKDTLMAELIEKLKIAEIIGFVRCTSTDTWCFNNFHERELSPNHVTLFWKLYGDTLRPIIKGEDKKKPENTNEDQKEERKVKIYNEETL